MQSITLPENIFFIVIEYGIFGEGSQISTNQKREGTVFSLLIGQNLIPFPKNTVLRLYWGWQKQEVLKDTI